MFKNKNIFNKASYYFHPITLFVIIISFFIFIYYFIRNKFQKNKIKVTDLQLFADFIYDYVLKTRVDDDSGNITFTIYKYDDTLINVSRQDAFGADIPNYQWDLHTEAFMDVILKVQELVILTCKDSSKFYKNKQIWEQLVPHFIDSVTNKIPANPTEYRVPFGTNWYQFSITWPKFLTIVSYLYRRLFGKRNDHFEGVLANYINAYFKKSEDKRGILSMGWHRDGPNAVMMAVPYIGGHLLMKTLDKEDSVNQYVREYVSLPEVTTGEGLYPDYGFIFHNTLRAYGYIYSAANDFLLISQFCNLPLHKLQKIYNILEHPTIPLHFSAFFTRSASCSNPSLRGLYGFYVMPSVKIIAVKTQDWYLSFNGQTNKLCYYESDKGENAWGQIWISARVFMYENSDKRWWTQLATYYPGVMSYDNKLIKMVTTTETTTTFLPTNAKCIICKSGDYIGMRNEYTIDYENSDSGDTHKIEVIEMILITNLGYHICYKIKPDQTKQKLTVSLNLGELINHDRTPTMYQFKNNYTIYYGSDVPKKITVKHPDNIQHLTALQVEPDMRNKKTGVVVAFSTIHQKTNEIKNIPTIEDIDLHYASLHYDPEYPNYLWLHDRTKSEVIVGKFSEEYKADISISSSMILKVLGANALPKNFPTNVQALIGEDGYQMSFKAPSDFSLIKTK